MKTTYPAGIERVIVNGKSLFDRHRPTGVINGTDIKYQSNKEQER